MTGIDLNRAGTPLLEIVSEPDMRSAEEAIAYAKTLHTLVRWIGICDGNMQEGNFRCDANVSVRKSGEAKLGTRCEIKNLNSFRFLQHAIEFEVRRQIELIEDGGAVEQETRLYDPERDETRSMRTKEDAQDYRYFPDPDLPPLVIDEAWIERVKSAMPELQAAMKLRLEVTHGLTEEQATAVTASQAHAAYYHELAAAGVDPKDAANFMRGPLAAALNAEGGEDAMIRVPPSLSAALLHRVSDNTISATSAVGLFGGLLRRYFTLGVGPVAATESAAATIDEMIEEGDLKQISDAGAIGKIVDDVIAANASIVAEYKAGREKAFNSLVGRVMAATQGKANPAQVNAILKQKLSRASV
jgi:aspartyl-tRNA(Asn)/glutamyl-tRNA(Gln) amidotransferase subunit B